MVDRNDQIDSWTHFPLLNSCMLGWHVDHEPSRICDPSLGPSVSLYCDEHPLVVLEKREFFVQTKTINHGVTYQSNDKLHELFVDLVIEPCSCPWANEVPVDRRLRFLHRQQGFSLERVRSNEEHRRWASARHRGEHRRWSIQQRQLFYFLGLEKRKAIEILIGGTRTVPVFFICRTSRDRDSGGRLVFDMNKRFKMILLNFVPVRRAKNR